MEEFLRKKRLRWLGHVERMDEERGPVEALLLEVDGTKKGRSKKEVERSIRMLIRYYLFAGELQ